MDLDLARGPVHRVCLFVVITLSITAASAGVAGTRQASKLLEQQRFGDFTIRTFWDDADEPGRVEVVRNGRLVYSRDVDGKVVIGNDVNKGTSNDASIPTIPVGTDLTGLGKPDVILAAWTGGAHCCFDFHVLELGDPVREVAVVNADHSDGAHFEDVDHDGRYEFVGVDWAFAYWHTSFADSPAPRIVLRFDGKARYGLAFDLMRKPAPAESELNNLAAEVLQGPWSTDRVFDNPPEGFPPPLLWETMLDLIYTGHPDLAWKFVRASWAPGHVSEQAFLDGFCDQLARSRYFQDLRPMVVNAPCTFRPSNGQKGGGR